MTEQLVGVNELRLIAGRDLTAEIGSPFMPLIWKLENYIWRGCLPETNFVYIELKNDNNSAMWSLWDRRTDWINVIMIISKPTIRKKYLIGNYFGLRQSVLIWSYKPNDDQIIDEIKWLLINFQYK
jgi:hypothetical protein